MRINRRVAPFRSMWYLLRMKAMQLNSPAGIERGPLGLVELDRARPARGEVLIRVSACGVCRTDLHITEGDIPLPLLPVIPGHQVVGVIAETGADVAGVHPGMRVGVPWLRSTCHSCGYCRSGRENLCDHAQFNGYHRHGGYAEYIVVPEESVYALPEDLPDLHAAPLLCAGVIGYRALRLSGVQSGEKLGLYGFGASAHVTLQVARHMGCDVYVFTRSAHHCELAGKLGAVWTGSVENDPPRPLDAAVIFAPAGLLVHHALRNLNKGGAVALAGIHMSAIPAMDYQLIYGERVVRTVANSTREDVRELLDLAASVPIRTEVESFPLEEANTVLQKLKRSELAAAGVLTMIR